MSQELTYFLYFIGYLLAVLIVDDQLFPFLNNLKKSLASGVSRFHDQSKHFFANGENIYNTIKSSNSGDSRHRNTFIFIVFVSILLMSQNIISLSTVLGTVPALGLAVIDNAGSISNLTWGMFLAFGVVLIEFGMGWALYYKKEAQVEDGPKDVVWGPIGAAIIFVMMICLFGETIVWYQISEAVVTNDEFVNPFQGGLFEGLSSGFIGLLGFGMTLGEYVLAYMASREHSKFNGLQIVEKTVSIFQYIRSLSFFVLSLIMYLATLIFKLLPLIIFIIEQVILFISIPAHFITKKIPWLK
jgi:hypothetical protein